jgi:hypothetical protein
MLRRLNLAKDTVIIVASDCLRMTKMGVSRGSRATVMSTCFRLLQVSASRLNVSLFLSIDRITGSSRMIFESTFIITSISTIISISNSRNIEGFATE